MARSSPLHARFKRNTEAVLRYQSDVFRCRSEITETIAATRQAIAQSRALMAEADEALERSWFTSDGRS